MEAVKKLFGGYLIGVAMVVAVWFIINSFFADSFNTLNVWYTLDVLMVIGLAIALIFNYARKREEERGREPVEAVSRRHLEVNTAFYLTAGITILFLHNWFSLLANGSDSLEGNHQAWVIWAVVDTLLPLVLGVTGCAMWRDAAGE
ncbi:MAG: hypothetical protein F4X66_09775 [Chloroflexi bacterium]|nr:hypothetical protein [Chloroflexota bacterium]MYE39105.1 hypothetical protein [Chloroflexota bacterium]